MSRATAFFPTEAGLVCRETADGQPTIDLDTGGGVRAHTFRESIEAEGAESGSVGDNLQAQGRGKFGFLNYLIDFLATTN